MEQTARARLAVGTVICDRYRIESLLGYGAMGQVYEVEHLAIGRRLALKFLHPEFSSSPAMAARFEREARLSAVLEDPRLVQVTDFGAHKGQLFMVMEMIRGADLGQRMKGGPIKPAEAIEIIDEILGGIAHAHQKGLIHRDLKPENVILSPYGPRILDFGLARPSESSGGHATLTQPGMVCGTPRYMSPEQASGERVDTRTDLYAAAVILHEMLSGKPMIQGESVGDTLRKQILEPAPPLKLLPQPDVDIVKLQEVLQKGLSKKPDQRYPDAETLRAAIAECKIVPVAAATQTRKMNPLPMVAAAIVLVISMAGFFALSGGSDDSDLEGQIRASLSSGKLELAHQRALRFRQVQPNSASAHLWVGHVKSAKDESKAAVASYRRAVELDPQVLGSEELQTRMLQLLSASSKDARIFIRDVSAGESEHAVPLLKTMALQAPHPSVRRWAYEGLERREHVEELEKPFEYLSAQLAANRTDVCTIRRWYVERLVALDEERAASILDRERKRKGGMFRLNRTGSCMSDLFQ